MAIDYNDIRKASSPNGLVDLLSSLGHEPISDWDGLVDIRPVLLEDNIPPSIRSSVADDAITIRELTSLVGEQKGIECYAAILRPGLKLSSSVCRNISHAFRNVSSITRIDETFLFIGVPDEKNTGLIDGEVKISQWATIHLSRVYRKAGSSEELRLSRLDWTPTKKSRHTLDCLKSLQVDAYPGQVDDTEVERFKKEVKEWFNKEKLSRRFFREFYKRFEFALDLVQRKARLENYEQFQPTKNKPITSYNKKDRESDPNRQNAGKFMLKQILRLLFLHYLQEKEWLCRDKNFLINQWRHYEKKTRSLPNYDATTATGFHSEVLIPLFFETLNRRRPDDAVTNWGGTRWDQGERSMMPYLNGGIFEIDKTHDHFNDDSGIGLFLIPDAVFSADRDYDPKLDDETLMGRQVNLLAFFDDYHFTIAEDTPVDEAVALDPELMGKIFENLLVSRHSDGAYYTPRSIVRFQCKDTLARYLEEQLADIGGLNYDWFLTLFVLDRDFSDQPVRDDESFSAVVADRIEAALKECKVLDPAVGSGAYLLGMLTEMLRLRQLCHMVKTGHMVDKGSVEFYRWKSEIIKHSLFGVDINPEAVGICHLRLWLAMVVDQDRESATSLPNLDFQVTPGDSLRDSINGNRIFVAPGQEGQATLWSYTHDDVDGPNDEPVKARIEIIRKLRHEYYDENAAPSKREEMRVELQRLRQTMMLEGLEQLEHYELKKLSKSKLSPSKKDMATNDVIAKFNDAKRRINEGSFTSIFSYEAIFGDIFQRKGRKGFDIIIGNPPYLEDEGVGGYDDIQKLLGLTSNNLYAMFWIRSIRDLVRVGGQVSYITSDSFYTIRGHTKTREIMFKETEIQYAIQAGNWFFTFNNSWTAILTCVKRQSPLSHTEAAQIQDMFVAYDITKLPPKDLSALENALDRWKINENNVSRMATLESDLVSSGDDSTWKLNIEGGGFSPIARYSYPLGLPWRNTNIPIFHICPSLFKISWDVGDHAYTHNMKNVEEWKENIPANLIQLNGKSTSFTNLISAADVKKGLDTADVNHYLRRIPSARGNMELIDKELLLTAEELSKIHDDQSLRSGIVKNGIPSEMFGGKHFIPFSKPPKQSSDDLNMFYCEPEYFIDWSAKTVNELRSFTIADVKRRTNPSFVGNAKQEKNCAAVVRNDSFYITPHLHMTLAGENAPQIWMPFGGITGHGTSILSPKIHTNSNLIGYLSSNLFAMLAKGLRGSLANTEVGTLSFSPIPLLLPDCEQKISKLIEFKKARGRLSRENETWQELSDYIAQELGLSAEQISEVNRWAERRYCRPGVVDE